MKVGRASSDSPVASQGRAPKKKKRGRLFIFKPHVLWTAIGQMKGPLFSFVKKSPCRKRKGKVFASKRLFFSTTATVPGIQIDRARFFLMQCNSGTQIWLQISRPYGDCYVFLFL
jgi:hypothetical protein